MPTRASPNFIPAGTLNLFDLFESRSNNSRCTEWKVTVDKHGVETFSCLVCLDGRPRSQLSANRHSSTRQHLSSKAPGSAYSKLSSSNASLRGESSHTGSISSTPAALTQQTQRTAPLSFGDLEDGDVAPYPETPPSPTFLPHLSPRLSAQDLDLQLSLSPMEQLQRHISSLHAQAEITDLLETLSDDDERDLVDNTRGFLLTGEGKYLHLFLP